LKSPLARVISDKKQGIAAKDWIGAMQRNAQIVRSEEVPHVRVALLTGGGDKPYALGLASALIAKGLSFDFIGSDDVNSPDFHNHRQVRFLNLRGNQREDVSVLTKVLRVLTYYGRLLKYTATAEPTIIHILWNNKIEFFDRTLLLIYYRLLGKRIVFTAHNVNAAQRDGNDSLLNRLTLRIQYSLVNHIFVHTEKAKQQLASAFTVPDCKISVIPFGINSSTPNTALTTSEAKTRVGLTMSQKAILFFGNIAPYKGLEYLVQAMGLLKQTKPDYTLLIAGYPKNCAPYWEKVQEQISRSELRPNNIIERIEFVPDEETEVYFKAADVLILPYTHIFQSGVLSLGYNFGLPVIASDVGSLKEEIIPELTGSVFRPLDSSDLAEKLTDYFESDLYRQLDVRRHEIQEYANKRYSWATVADITCNVYKSLC